MNIILSCLYILFIFIFASAESTGKNALINSHLLIRSLLTDSSSLDPCELDILFNVYFCSNLTPRSTSGRTNRLDLARKCCELRLSESCVFDRVRPECLVRLQVLLLASQYQLGLSTQSDQLTADRYSFGLSRWSECEHFDHRRCSNVLPLWFLMAACVLVLVIFAVLLLLNAYGKYKKFVYVDI
jgi:hypothetical protein